jgi:Flp pilus assembly protein TadG
MVTLRRLRSLLRQDSGATLVEATLIFPMLMILTFGLVEFGHALWRYGTAEKATAIGARYLATRGPLVAGVADCFVNTSAAAGTPCSQIPEAATALGWSQTVSSTSCSASSTTVFCQMFAKMHDTAPFLTAPRVQVVLQGSGLGFVGRGKPIPLITVRTTGLTYNFVALDDLLGLPPITMPGFDATLVGEDQKEGP